MSDESIVDSTGVIEAHHEVSRDKNSQNVMLSMKR